MIRECLFQVLTDRPRMMWKVLALLKEQLRIILQSCSCGLDGPQEGHATLWYGLRCSWWIRPCSDVLGIPSSRDACRIYFPISYPRISAFSYFQ
ncbi:hypothetical protein TNIN_90921 [Trichonephila inaurata madagascariensis]|uniref:Uncharacterized protein n=1 Tax=Trichonephila inaurata madagascariensis TaxID=2747483 RepID=A0A8X6Y4T6_9ARAC|nr:hypothetical protein TNIN_90921 [Trichonephila inaurata madagascariensis]